jgi:hypothetical protein
MLSMLLTLFAVSTPLSAIEDSLEKRLAPIKESLEQIDLSDEVLPEWKENDFKTLTKGELLMVEKKIAGESWHEWTFYCGLSLSGKEALAVLSDYQHQLQYVPGLLKADIVKEYAKNSHDVAFKLKAPWPVSSLEYTTLNSLLYFKKTDTWALAWTLTEAKAMEVSRGRISFLKIEDEKKKNLSPFVSLMAYRSFVRPKSIFAGMLRDKARHDLKKSVEAICKHLNAAKMLNPQLTDRQLTRLERKATAIEDFMNFLKTLSK